MDYFKDIKIGSCLRIKRYPSGYSFFVVVEIYDEEISTVYTRFTIVNLSTSESTFVWWDHIPLAWSLLT